MPHRFSLSVVALISLLTLSPVQAQLDADSAMQEANALFRSGLYNAALMRYREARAAGLDSPLLHYNLGVVYYRLREYDDAAYWLEQAVVDDRLAPLAAYNLGLVHRAAGMEGEAQRWFERAATGPDRALRELAARAQTSEPGERTAGPVGNGAARRADDPREPLGAPGRLGKFEVLASARYGQDNNVYGGPAEPYVDLSSAGQPTVTPVVYSAGFLPVDVVAQYVMENEAGDTDFIFGYRMNGDFYDAEFSNANRVSQRFDIGADIVLGEKAKRRRTVQSAFFLRSQAETNFDPDSGLDRSIGSVDLSDRYSYRAAGVEGEFGHEIGAWYWGLEMQLEKRIHEDLTPIQNNDHEFFFSAATVEYAFSEKTTLSFGMRRYRRVYDERLARDLDGALLAANDVLRYDYRGVQLGLSRRIARSFRVDLDLLAVERVDEYLGYYDYNQHVARLRASYRPHPRVALTVSAVARTYEYPNAFAFNEPTAPLRETDSSGIELDFEFRVNDRMAVWAGIDSVDVTSTDPRAAYARTLSMLGLIWRR